MFHGYVRSSQRVYRSSTLVAPVKPTIPCSAKGALDRTGTMQPSLHSSDIAVLGFSVSDFRDRSQKNWELVILESLELARLHS
jgi:hypothetical protein